MNFALFFTRCQGWRLAVLCVATATGPAFAQAPLGAVGESSVQMEATPTASAAQPPEGAVGGMGDVNLYPKRVVMSDRERTATIGLYNRAAGSGDYDITITDMMMLPEGRLVELAAAADPVTAARVRGAGAMIKWSPHRVTLPANEAQLVRIMVRIPPDLPAGEYRSHFSAISIPAESGDLSIEDVAGNRNDGVGVQIVPRFGISIPVIVRIGETTLTAGIRDFAVDRASGAPPTFRLTLTRQGTRSAFGNIAVTSAAAKAPIAQIKGVGVYTEIDERYVTIPVDPQADPALYARGAKLTVTYTDDDYAPGQVLARADIVVP